MEKYEWLPGFLSISNVDTSVRTFCRAIILPTPPFKPNAITLQHSSKRVAVIFYLTF
jgi:hypothetical protein